MVEIVSKFNKNNVVFKQPRKMHQLPITKQLSQKNRKEVQESESKKLLNIMFHNGQYWLQEPFPDK